MFVTINKPFYSTTNSLVFASLCLAASLHITWRCFASLGFASPVRLQCELSLRLRSHCKRNSEKVMSEFCPALLRQPLIQ